MPRLSTLFCLLTLSTSAIGEADNHWFAEGEASLQRALEQRPIEHPARNVILFVGDGMGIATVTAARILDGQEQGKLGEEHQLAFEKLPYLGLSKTYNSNQQTPDSAGTMSAMMTGIKTKAGFISITESAQRGRCNPDTIQPATTLLELAEQQGRATGIVTTARITHATPAATYAHSPERNWESDNQLPSEAKQQGCRDIAQQLIEFPYGDGLEVIFGGGLRNFKPSPEGKRTDNRDLTHEWLQQASNRTLLNSRDALNHLTPTANQQVMGLFSQSHMAYEADRNPDAEPSLSEMTAAAIQQLNQHPNGYFLMVEGARIDHGHHAGNAYRALHEVREMSRAVEIAQQMTSREETLIIVTADHSHVMTMGGYTTRGNPILGPVIVNDAQGEPQQQPHLADDGHPYTSLTYANGRGLANSPKGPDARYSLPINTGRQLRDEHDPESPHFHQEALTPLSAETHGGEEVAIYADGPWAHLFHKTHEQHYIFHVMRHAMGLNHTPLPQNEQH